LLKYILVEKYVIGICDLISSFVLKAVLRHVYLECELNSKTPTHFHNNFTALSVFREQNVTLN
jgi:hypothetical protein